MRKSNLIIRCPISYDSQMTRDLSVLKTKGRHHHFFEERINIIPGRSSQIENSHDEREFISIDKCLRCKFGLRMILNKCNVNEIFEEFKNVE